jgi:hypothetical protein
MKKRKTRLTADDWKRFADHQRELQERVALLDRKIAAQKAARDTAQT